MAADNDQIAREKELAREFEKKMAARDRLIKATTEKNFPPREPKPGVIYGKSLHQLFDLKFSAAFAEKKYDVILRITYDHLGYALEREPFFFSQVKTASL